MAYTDGMDIPHGQTDYGGAEAPRSKEGQHLDSTICLDGHFHRPADGIGSLLRLCQLYTNSRCSQALKTLGLYSFHLSWCHYAIISTRKGFDQWSNASVAFCVAPNQHK